MFIFLLLFTLFSFVVFFDSKYSLSHFITRKLSSFQSSKQNDNNNNNNNNNNDDEDDEEEEDDNEFSLCFCFVLFCYIQLYTNYLSI